jgi:hypothetical protein
MRINVTCVECARLHKSTKGKASFYKVDLRNDDNYRLTCEQGHVTTTRLINSRCEILFQMGIAALADGYFRDAVVSGTAAMERFFEFFVQTAWIHLKVTKEDRETAWKTMSKQSERQLGAFIGAYVTLFKKPPTLLPNKDSQFRNEVVHKGYIPSKQEAIAYLDTLLGILNPIILEMRSLMPVAADQWHAESSPLAEAEWQSAMGFNTALCVNDKTDRAWDVKRPLELYEDSRDRVGAQVRIRRENEDDLIIA